MSELLAYALMVLFALHLLGFLVLGIRRRQAYYLSLILTFSLLTASFASYLYAPEWDAGGLPLFQLLRYLAWIAAAVSVSWTLTRLRRRIRARRAPR
ncbi:MAG: hypothetical protein V2I82_15080 [Halieaceae bacterium]|jgi:hypothetical protein|nr:hypothetical protein [Halieaceae bacterium]